MGKPSSPVFFSGALAITRIWQGTGSCHICELNYSPTYSRQTLQLHVSAVGVILLFHYTFDNLFECIVSKFIHHLWAFRIHRVNHIKELASVSSLGNVLSTIICHSLKWSVFQIMVCCTQIIAFKQMFLTCAPILYFQCEGIQHIVIIGIPPVMKSRYVV